MRSIVGQPPILVTGAHRTGTTWVANVLALAPGTALVGREPFNTGPRQWGVGGAAEVDYAYIGDLDERAVRRAYRRVLAGRVPQLIGRQGRRQLDWLLPWRHPRVIVKDPLAAMSAASLSDEFGLDVVVVLRHPAAFAASLDRMGWRFDWRTLQSQPGLLSGPLASLRDRITSPPSDTYEQAGLLWQCIYTVLLNAQADRPRWHLLRHRAASQSPIPTFQELVQSLGLRWTTEVAEALAVMTATHNPVAADNGVVHQLHRDSGLLATAWMEQLTPGQRDRVRRGAAPLGEELYGEPRGDSLGR